MGEDDRLGRTLTIPLSCVAPPGGPGEGSSFFGRLAQAQATLARERAEAPRLCEELLAQPEPVQLGLASLDRRFHTWGVCELLLARAFHAEDIEDIEDAEEGAPSRSGHLALLALATADHLDTELHAEAVVQDFRAKAWACVGEARRRDGDVEAAEGALRAAASCLTQGTGDLLVEGRLLEFEAAVRKDQGRLGEAGALLDQAAARYEEIGETQLHARAVRKRGEI